MEHSYFSRGLSPWFCQADLVLVGNGRSWLLDSLILYIAEYLISCMAQLDPFMGLKRNIIRELNATEFRRSLDIQTAII